MKERAWRTPDHTPVGRERGAVEACNAATVSAVHAPHRQCGTEHGGVAGGRGGGGKSRQEQERTVWPWLARSRVVAAATRPPRETSIGVAALRTRPALSAAVPSTAVCSLRSVYGTATLDTRLASIQSRQTRSVRFFCGDILFFGSKNLRLVECGRYAMVFRWPEYHVCVIHWLILCFQCNILSKIKSLRHCW